MVRRGSQAGAGQAVRVGRSGGGVRRARWWWWSLCLSVRSPPGPWATASPQDVGLERTLCPRAVWYVCSSFYRMWRNFDIPDETLSCFGRVFLDADLVWLEQTLVFQLAHVLVSLLQSVSEARVNDPSPTLPAKCG